MMNCCVCVHAYVSVRACVSLHKIVHVCVCVCVCVCTFTYRYAFAWVVGRTDDLGLNGDQLTANLQALKLQTWEPRCRPNATRLYEMRDTGWSLWCPYTTMNTYIHSGWHIVTCISCSCSCKLLHIQGTCLWCCRAAQQHNLFGHIFHSIGLQWSGTHNPGNTDRHTHKVT